jgi:hypothetical protein
MWYTSEYHMSRRSVSKPVELERSRAPLVVIGVVVVGILMTSGTILWAKRDTGQIDVSAALANSKRITEENRGDTNAPPSPPAPPEYTTMSNGGLQPQGSDAPRPPEPAPAPMNEATSTDAAGSAENESETTSDTEDAREAGATESVTSDSDGSDISAPTPSQESVSGEGG